MWDGDAVRTKTGGNDFLFLMCLWTSFFSTFSTVIVTMHLLSLCLFQHGAALFPALWLASQPACPQAWAWHLLVELWEHYSMFEAASSASGLLPTVTHLEDFDSRHYNGSWSPEQLHGSHFNSYAWV